MHSGRLEDYPGLKRWYGIRKGTPPTGESPEGLLYLTCQTLEKGPDHLPEWIDGLSSLFTGAGDPAEALEAAKSLALTCDVDLMDLISDFGESALQVGLGRAFQECAQDVAENTGSISFRFLSAWSALNEGDTHLCIAECERGGEEFAAINALKGQALLEQGQPTEAIKALSLAVQQSPDELLAWFQLAKACHVTDRYDSAWNALLQCRRLAPQSHEVGLFMAMVCTTDPTHGALKAPLAWDALLPALVPFGAHSQVVLNLIRLAALMNDERKAAHVIERANWEKLVVDPDFIRLIGGVLQGLEKRGWYSAARDLLIRTTGSLEKTS